MCLILHAILHFRYFKVCRPLQTESWSSERGVKVQLVLVIAVSILIDIPRYLENRIEEIAINGGTYYFLTSTDLWDNFLYQLLYKTLAMVAIRRILPISVTLIVTIFLVRYLYKRRHIQKKLLASGVKDVDKKDHSVTSVLIIIAICFIMCHLPGTIYPIFRIAMDIPANCDNFYTYFSTIADMLSMLNSALNFFIYYPTIPSFKKKLLQLCQSCIDSNEVGPLRSSQMFGIDSKTLVLPTQDQT